MATATIVITYTPAVDGGSNVRVDSYTLDGTAYGSLTAAQIEKATCLMRKAEVAIIRDAKTSIKGHNPHNVNS